MDVYHTMNRHLHTTFTLVTTVLASFGIFLVFKKRSRVDMQKQTISTRNPPRYDLRYLRIAQSERKFVTTSFCILLFLIISIIPYFLVGSLEAKCRNCRNQGWFFIFRETSIVFLFVNSAVNPLLTTFRINELNQSEKIVLGLRRQGNQGDIRLRSCGQPGENMQSQV